MRYGSVCSGIEASSVAWEPLGWECAWVSEVEPFPCAVLAHHYPSVPNLGDMTTIAARLARGQVEPVDLLVGGTPCQSFSVAGLRQGLADDRGNLALAFVELSDAISARAAACSLPGPIVLWENVPGVLSDSTNAFGCLVAGLAGCGSALVPVGGEWPRAGMVVGPRRRVAWAVLDAQFFGVPQRRRRVFVLAVPVPAPADARGHPGGAGLDPSAILALGQGVCRDPSPREDQRERVAPSLAARTRGGGGLGSDAECDGAHPPAIAWGISSDALDRSGEGKAKTAGERAGLGIVEGLQPALRARSNNAVAFHLTQDPISGSVAPALSSGNGAGCATLGVQQRCWVRRLTVTECSRLQGFPDTYLDVLFRGKPACDGPRYRALGNSMAVPVMRWIGERIAASLTRSPDGEVG